MVEDPHDPFEGLFEGQYFKEDKSIARAGLTRWHTAGSSLLQPSLTLRAFLLAALALYRAENDRPAASRVLKSPKYFLVSGW
jgi:hypothetical protein